MAAHLAVAVYVQFPGSGPQHRRARNKGKQAQEPRCWCAHLAAQSKIHAQHGTLPAELHSMPSAQASPRLITHNIAAKLSDTAFSMLPGAGLAAAAAAAAATAAEAAAAIAWGGWGAQVSPLCWWGSCGGGAGAPVPGSRVASTSMPSLQPRRQHAAALLGICRARSR